MKKYIFLISFLFLLSKSFSQTFLNGDFEINTAGSCKWNMTNIDFNSTMANTFADGSLNEVDIQKASCGYSNPQHGNYFVSLRSYAYNGDQINMELSGYLIKGKKYKISFYEKADTLISKTVDSLEVRISHDTDGNFEYYWAVIDKSLPPTDHWAKRTISFICPFTGRYIQVCGNNNWYQDALTYVDNFYFDTCTINFDFGNDRTLCDGETLLLNATTPDATYLWQDSSTNSTFNVNKKGAYWVQISKSGCAKRDTINISYNPLPKVNLGNDTMLCPEQKLILIPTGGMYDSYLWQDGSVKPACNVSQKGTYWVEVKRNNCKNRDSVFVNYYPLHYADLGKDTMACEGKTVELKVSVPVDSCIWQDGSDDSIFKVTKNGLYWIKTSYKGCIFNDSINVQFFDCSADCKIFVPDVFTPNNDGLNDVFDVKTACYIKAYSIMIFSVWGEKIYESSDINSGWNGMYNNKKAQTGTYYYYINAITKGKTYNLSGAVHLLR